MEAIKSLVVCVEFDDFLSISLPRNKKHFSRTLVVTSCRDIDTQRIALENGCECFITDSFYERGAVFNKGAAIEKGLDVLGRDGWLCLWDADIVMPQTLLLEYDPACLYTPLRRTLVDPSSFNDELDWNSVEVTTHEKEYPGYFQLFHSSAAGSKPWFETHWAHAGGYDSNFQHRFRTLKRPSFHVMHLGPSVDKVSQFYLRIGENWCGRTSDRIDNKSIDQKDRKNLVSSFINARKLKSSLDAERLV